MAQIVYLEDIVKELSEELDIPEVEVREICENSISYINELTKDPNTISIRIPNLGIMYFNRKRAKYTYNISNNYRKYVSIVKSQLEIIDKLAKENKRLAHAKNSYYTMIRKVFFKNITERGRSKKADVLKKLEMKQNKLFK